MNTTKIFVYGFPELVESTTIGNILLADSIHEQTNWNINYDEIDYLPGCVWDYKKKQFQPGRSAHIYVPDVVTAVDIQIINAAENKSDNMFNLTYKLAHSTDDNALSNGKDSHNDYYNYGHQNCKMRLSERATYTSKTYVIPQHRQNCITPQSKSHTPIDDTSHITILPTPNTIQPTRAPSIPQYKRDYNNNHWYNNDLANTINFDRFSIQPSVSNAQTMNDAPIKSRRIKFKGNILGNLNEQIQQHIQYNANINGKSKGPTSTPVYLITQRRTANISIINKPKMPSIPHKLPLQTPKELLTEIRTCQNVNSYAIVRALTHYNPTEVGVLNGESAPHQSPKNDGILNGDKDTNTTSYVVSVVLLMPSIKQSLTYNGFVLNNKNENRFEPRVFFIAIINSKAGINNKL